MCLESQDKELTEERIETQIKEKWQKIKDTIYKASKKLKMFTKNIRSRFRDENWDNGEYRDKRKCLFKLLHRFRKQRDWYTNFEYLKCRKEINKLRNDLIKNWLNEKQQKVAECKNLKEW